MAPHAHLASELAALRSISSLLPFLPPDAHERGAEVAREIEATLASVSYEAIGRVDAWYREESPYFTSRLTWEQMRLWPLPNWAHHSPGVIAVATLHRSGFVREAAVRLLADAAAPYALPFLLVRLNDWVPQVRFVAGIAIQARLTQAHARVWADVLGVYERTCEGRRADHKWLRGPLIALFDVPESRAHLLDAMTSGHRNVRAACLHLAVGLRDPSPFVRAALVDPDPAIATRAALAAAESLKGDELLRALDLMRRGNARARYLALEATCTHFPEAAEAQLREALLDEATDMRELARFQWKKLGLVPVEFAAFYRDRIAQTQGALFIAALRGLGETGHAEDAQLLLAYARDPRARVREAGVIGVGKLDGAHHGELFAKALRDSNLRVAKAAQRFARLYLGSGAVSQIKRSRTE